VVVRLIAGLLLAVHAGLLLHALRLHSVTIDEASHIPAGLVHWHAGTHAAFRVNPPLPRMLATVPLLLTNCQWVGDGPRETDDPHQRSEVSIRQPFYQFNRDHYYDYVFLARVAGILWSCFGAWLVFRWAGELYGSAGGLLALTLWCFEPTILGHAQIVTPDVPCTVAGLLVGYLFWQYIKEPIWPRAAGVGLALGLALLTKFTLLALLPVGLVALIVARGSAETTMARAVGRRLGHAVLALALTLLVVNAGYMFDGTGRRLGEIPFISRSLAGERTEPRRGAEGAGNRLRGTMVGWLPAPVPEDWLRGIDVQRRDFEELGDSRPSYLAGEWRNRGWWYYYLYALGVKLPFGTIVLGLAGFALALLRSRWSSGWRDELAIYLPGVAILILVSSQTGFNHHMRYALPAIPFFLVGAGKLAAFVRPWHWLAGSLVAGLVLWAGVSSLRVYPHSMSYFNEIAGGPENGHAHLIDSNIDWGQDVFFLKKWMDAHPEARPMRMAVFNFTQWDILGQERMYPPSGL
jgi:hypothetical protein